MKRSNWIRAGLIAAVTMTIALMAPLGIFSDSHDSAIAFVSQLQPNISDNASSCNSPEETFAEQLSCLIYQREQLMKYVAADKYLRYNPIFDASQELRVLGRAGKKAQDNELPVIDVTLYAQILMDISKQIQGYYLAQWKERQQTPPLDAPTVNEIRQQIGEIDEAIINKFGEIRRSCSIQSRPELEDTLLEWLAQLPGIQPEWNTKLFSEMLAASIHPIVYPVECQPISG